MDSIDVAFRGSGEGVLGGRASYRLKRGVIDLDPLLVSEAETVSLTMRFTPLNPNGLLFWMGEEQTFSDYFLALALTDGYFEARFNFGGSKDKVLRTNSQLATDSTTHLVILTVFREKLRLNVDGVEKIEASFQSSFDPIFPSSEYVFLGGAAEPLDSYSGRRYASGFYGCLHDMTYQVKNPGELLQTKQVSFLRDTTDPSFAEENNQCSVLTIKPASTTPMTKPSTQKSTTTTMYTTATTMATTAKGLDPVSCRTGDKARFNGRGFLLLQNKAINIPDETSSLDIDLAVVTSSPDGILMYQGSPDSDSLSLRVVDGRVVYELMSGSGGGNGVVLKSNKRIDDGQRYIIQASRDSTTVTLTVADKGDGDTVDKAIPSGMTLTGLHDGDGLLIGGVRDSTSLENGFIGQIDVLAIYNIVDIAYGAKLFPYPRRRSEKRIFIGAENMECVS